MNLDESLVRESLTIIHPVRLAATEPRTRWITDPVAIRAHLIALTQTKHILLYSDHELRGEVMFITANQELVSLSYDRSVDDMVRAGKQGIDYVVIEFRVDDLLVGIDLSFMNAIISAGAASIIASINGFQYYYIADAPSLSDHVQWNTSHVELHQWDVTGHDGMVDRPLDQIRIAYPAGAMLDAISSGIIRDDSYIIGRQLDPVNWIAHHPARMVTSNNDTVLAGADTKDIYDILTKVSDMWHYLTYNEQQTKIQTITLICGDGSIQSLDVRIIDSLVSLVSRIGVRYLTFGIAYYWNERPDVIDVDFMNRVIALGAAGVYIFQDADCYLARAVGGVGDVPWNHDSSIIVHDITGQSGRVPAVVTAIVIAYSAGDYLLKGG